MMLEAISDGAALPIPLPIARNPQGIWESNWAPLVPLLLDNARTPANRGGVFHASLAQTLLEQARLAREEHGVRSVGLCGGVFQNRLLAETALALLQDDGFGVYLSVQLPSNDAAISYGQIIEYTSI